MRFYPPEFKVRIPSELTALYPAPQRDYSRLLVVSRTRGEVIHIGVFADLPHFLTQDLLVVNESRVLPARVDGFRPGGGKVEVLFLIPPFLSSSSPGNEEIGSKVKVLIKPSRRLKPGLSITLPDGAQLELVSKDPIQGWNALWRWRGVEKMESYRAQGSSENLHEANPLKCYLEKFGYPPLPPYIKRAPQEEDRERYQTVYARQGHSLAAPTAGLHFTPALLEQLRSQGCRIVTLNLNIHLGTFTPLRSSDFSRHIMPEESYELPPSTAEAVNQAHTEGRRVTAVGTTVVRALEDSARRSLPLQPGYRTTQLFIYPPFTFRIVDRLITNFHRPDSTLLQLVAAFAGWDLVNLAYQRAVDEGFRFFSYGDAMLIL
ncbi:MAG: tRNA preQ1(34) S-adenosylmethionine ribosyltransferase-isomerase QueA [bacterium]